MKKIIFFNKYYWDKLRATCKRMDLAPYLTPYTKINSKWTKDLNVRAKTINSLEEIVGVGLHDLQFGKGFLDKTPKA